MPDDVTACPYCGSIRVYPKIWVQGFFPTVNAERQIHECRDCGREGTPIRFTTEAERLRFAEEARTGAVADPPKPATDAIPILALDAVPLLEVRGVDAVPIYRTKVVDVRWTDRRLERGSYRMDVGAYWDAVGGSRYNAERIYLLDIGGINRGKPDFDELRMITKRTTALLDLGVRGTEDVMDGYMLDVEAVVVGTKTLRSLQQFAEIREISEGIVPCLDLAGGVVWSPLSHEEPDLRTVAGALRKIGFSTLAVMDLRRLGTFSGPDPNLLAQLVGLDAELFLGGGIREEDAPGLRERGIPHALIDPFTPVIRSLLPSEKQVVPADALPVAEPKRDVRGTPAPS